MTQGVAGESGGAGFDLGDLVVARTTLGGWRHRVQRGTPGVIAARTGKGRLVVHFVPGPTLTVHPDRLRRLAPE
jgi:hypothetical protein